MSMKGEVVTLVTILGEIVGKLVEENDRGFVIEKPRLFVPAQDGKNGGFAPGICMTGVPEPSELEFNRHTVTTVTLSHPQIGSAWVEATSGIAIAQPGDV